MFCRCVLCGVPDAALVAGVPLILRVCISFIVIDSRWTLGIKAANNKTILRKSEFDKLVKEGESS